MKSWQRQAELVGIVGEAVVEVTAVPLGGIDIAEVAVEKGVLIDIVRGLAHGRALALPHIHLRVLTLVHTLFRVPFPGLVHLVGDDQDTDPSGMTGCINLLKLNKY